MVGVLQDDGAGALVGDDLLQVRDADLLVDGDQPAGRLERDSLAVVGIGKPDIGLRQLVRLLLCDQFVDPADDRRKPFRERMIALADADIEIGPAPVDVAM